MRISDWSSDVCSSDLETGSAPEELERLATLYRRADGFLIVSAEYNHGIPPALKNLPDHFLEEYFWRPSAIACYSAGDWKGAWEGTSVTVRVDLGGARRIKKKKKPHNMHVPHDIQ